MKTDQVERLIDGLNRLCGQLCHIAQAIEGMSKVPESTGRYVPVSYSYDGAGAPSLSNLPEFGGKGL